MSASATPDRCELCGAERTDEIEICRSHANGGQWLCEECHFGLGFGSDDETAREAAQG